MDAISLQLRYVCTSPALVYGGMPCPAMHCQGMTNLDYDGLWEFYLHQKNPMYVQ